ncbi:MAG: hypothetical protein O2894_09230 [Planctomycetota bacterium]|nr:hypothetical protein [Planctomycetota bacterium]
MSSLYCPTCDLIFDEPVAECPACQGPVELWVEGRAYVDPRAGSISKGVVLCLVLHSLQLLVPLFSEPVMLLFVGLTQALYVVPAIIVLAIQGKTKTLSGVLIFSGVTFLLNAAVLGIMCGSMMSSGY